MPTPTLPRIATLVALVGFDLASPALADPPAPRIVDQLHIDGDFIDDPFALSSDGSRLAWITTDGATRSQLHVAVVGDKKSEKTFAYSSITPERVEFLDDDRVLVVERDPESRLVRAEVFGPRGGLGKFGPASEVGLGNVGNVPAIVTWWKVSAQGKGTSHTFTAWRRDNLKPLAKKVLVENSEGRVAFAGSLYKPLYFLDGYATLVGQKEGGYDKVHDIRKPEVAAKADIFSAKLLEEKEIKDVVEYATFTGLRAKHNDESNFCRFSDDRELQLVDSADAMAPLKTAIPVNKYDAETLSYRPAPGGNLTVALTIDPVNAEAVKAQKADKDWLDVYHLDVKSRALTQVARFDPEKRPTAWYLGGSRFALLRKHKTMGRGGADLVVYDLGLDKKPEAAPKAASAPPADKPAEAAAPTPPASAPGPATAAAKPAPGGKAKKSK